jgi:hypothetical protein
MKECIIIGGGSSVKEGIALGLWENIKDREIWSINFTYLFMPYLPKRELFYDTCFFKNKIVELQKLQEGGVELISKDAPIYDAYKGKVRVFSVCRVSKDWTDTNLFVGQLGLSGTMSLSLAIQERYDKIYLLGYDFGTPTYEDKNTHYYIDQVTEKNIKSSGIRNNSIYLETNNGMKPGVRDYEAFLPFKDKIVNVSPKSNIPYFERVDYQEFFRRIQTK